ncbi:MAG: protein phosphatase 2C domain-containing protein [Myxococcales bacterium]|nr:protein phosphatase 2C domain-containing protein [Polyangiaceae bacterium]MDW8250695.1 protein phosphatase 2C domain-containing protein [Myxococcales bacterium]
MSASWPRLLLGHQTDPGRDPSKQENEDALAYQETHLGHLLLVCDGMGGHNAGREASHLAVSTILAELSRAPQGSDPGEALAAAIREANRRVYALGNADQGRPGSTCVAAIIHPMGVDVAHVGDSRAYLIRAGQLWPLTRDHSMVREMVDAGILRPEDAQGHPESNKITRALGMDAEVRVELRSERILQQPGDLFVLVTDGVTDVVRDTDLQALGTVATETGQIPQFCNQVVQLANARGGPDNITILAAHVLDAGLRPEAAQQPPRRPPQATVVETVEAPLPDLPLASSHASSRTLPGIPPEALPVAPPTPLSAAPPPRRPGAGTTVPLPVHGPTSESKNAPLSGDQASPSPSRRRALGVLLMVIGLVVLGLAFGSLLAEDESPPPLLLGPVPLTSGSR